MKILIDARLYGLENTGIGRYTMNLVENLKTTDKSNKYIILLRKKYFDTLDFPENWKKVLADFSHYSFTEQIKLPSLINSLKPDVTHFVHFNVPILFRGKYVVTIHDLLMHQQKGFDATTLSKGMYLIKRMGYSLAFWTAVNASKAVIVPSSFVKGKILSSYGVGEDKVNVIYEGVEQLPMGGNDVLAKYDLKDKKYFIYTGNAYPHKNLERAIEAIELLNKNSKEKIYFCIVCARNYFVQKLEELIKKKGMESQVKVLGFVTDSELGELYKKSVAFLYPTLSEGFGLPGLEAMLSGTLLLASDIEVLKEVYKDSATFFDPKDPNSMKKAMEETLKLSDKDRKNKISYGQKFASKYSWSKMAKETLEVYNSVSKNA